MMLQRHPGQLPGYAGYVLARGLGTVLGHFADRMSRGWSRRLSMPKVHRDLPRRQQVERLPRS